MTSDKKSDVRIHAIGYGHLDPVWLWDWWEGVREGLATARSGILRMKEYADFKASYSSAAVYEWIEKYNPELFSEIQEAINENRWEIISGWWLEPDVNLPSGESLIRQGFYGKRYFKKIFNVDCLVGFNADTFGHPNTLPKILKHLGEFYYTFTRPDVTEKDLPNDVFVWEADDGSQVLTSRILQTYTTSRISVLEKIDRLFELAEANPVVSDVMCFYGVGDHGGGPTIQDIEDIHAFQKENPDKHVEFSTVHAYFMHLEAQRKELPVVTDELQHHARGCYSVNMALKQLNTQCENELLRYEKWATTAYQLLKKTFPVENIAANWKNILFQQFHDIITGTAIPCAIDDANTSFHKTLADCDQGLFETLRLLANHIPITAEEGEFIVFNSMPWSRRTPVTFEYLIPDIENKQLVDSTGQVIPTQFIQQKALTHWNRSHWVFEDTIPAMGYKCYHWREKPSETVDIEATGSLLIETDKLENSFWTLKFDPETGALLSLYDKVNSVDVITEPAGLARVFADSSDTWSHGIEKYEQFVGMFGAPQFSIRETGPVRAQLFIQTLYESSTMQQTWTIYRDDPRIEVALDLNWQQKQQVVKFCLPVNLTEAFCRSQQPYGQFERPADSEEHPFQRWIDVVGQTNDTDYGLTVLNNGLTAYSLVDNELQLTLCRSALFAHHDPLVPKADEIYEHTDQGHRRYQLMLRPHLGTQTPASIIRQAHELNEPVKVMVDYPHSGYLPKTNSFLEVSPENVVPTVFKKAEDCDELIVRLYETTGQETTGTLRLPYWKLESEFCIKPHELKTFRLKVRRSSLRLMESNALEE